MDAFEVFRFPRQPWVEPDLIQTRFLELSSDAHPDKFSDPRRKAEAEARFAQINAAHQVLRSSKSRLNHLLELQGGGVPRVQELPPEATALFPKIAATTAGLDRFLSGRDPNASPMIRVGRFQEALEWTEKAQALLEEISLLIKGLEQRAEGLNQAWKEPGGPNRALAEVARLAAGLGFMEKWQAQLAEKLGKLAQE